MASKASKRKRRHERNMARQERKKKAAAANPPERSGTELLRTEEDLSQDLALTKKAVVQQWPVTPSHASTIVERLVGIVEKKSVGIPAGDGGVFDSESEADKNAAKAAQLLMQMANANNKPKPQGTTVNVGVKIDGSADERRDRTLAIAERIGARAVLPDAAGGAVRVCHSTDPDVLPEQPVIIEPVPEERRGN